MTDNYENMSIEGYCKDYIIDELSKYEGQTHYTNDIPYYVMEEANANGSITFSTQEAMEFICHFTYECGTIIEEIAKELGHNDALNPLLNPERTMVLIVDTIVYDLCNQIDYGDNNEEKVEITNELIEEIEKQLKDIKCSYLS